MTSDFGVGKGLRRPLLHLRDGAVRALLRLARGLGAGVVGLDGELLVGVVVAAERAEVDERNMSGTVVCGCALWSWGREGGAGGEMGGERERLLLGLGDEFLAKVGLAHL